MPSFPAAPVTSTFLFIFHFLPIIINFYLLKKANFNNIHALSTIIETTENDSFKAIIEDILLGVEAGENMYTTMEYYAGVFPPIYINMIKVGELSRFINKGLRTSSKISGR